MAKQPIDRWHPDKCADVLIQAVHTMPTERIPLAKANRRVLAQDVVANYAVPHFDKSPYDGYAFRAQDTAGASQNNPVTLEIIEEIPAGVEPAQTIGPNQAAKILTGGMIPVGADICYKYEWTTFTDTTVTIYKETQPGDIIRQGEDIPAGHCLLTKGTVLGPGALGQLASQGIAEVLVYRRPRIGLLSTGTELVTAGSPLPPAKIYESNLTTLTALIENIGCEVVNYGVVPDDLPTIVGQLERLVQENDLVMTTGGASVGDYDYGVTASQAIDAEILFWKTAMKPGGSIVASLKDQTVILALSGNPGAALLSMFRVALPALYQLMGRSRIFPEKISMICAEGFAKKSPGYRLLRGHLDYQAGQVLFYENSGQGNGVLSSFVDCEAFLEIPPGGPVEAGAVLSGYLTSELFGMSSTHYQSERME